MKEPRHGTPDDENPEWTKEDFARARRGRDILPAALLEELRRTRGPQKAPTKTQLTLRLDPDVIAHFKAGGPGWQSRIDAALRSLLTG